MEARINSYAARRAVAKTGRHLRIRSVAMMRSLSLTVIIFGLDAHFLSAQTSDEPIHFEGPPASPALKPILGIAILLLALFCLLKPLALKLLTRHQPADGAHPGRTAGPSRPDRPYLKWTAAAFLVGLLLAVIAVLKNNGSPWSDGAVQQSPRRVFPPDVGSFFGELSHTPFRSPQIREIPLPQFAGSHAIWAATGRDRRGHIWLGVTTEKDVGSAHLLEFDPETGKVADHGHVIEELRRLGIDRPGEKQAKIHSKIYEGEDGFIYFSSMDEEGEDPDGSRLPIWGGHLWRMRLSDSRWEHLAATPEALIAVAAADHWIYALGYFGHVLYQYDTHTRQLRKLHIDSAGGHVSRNILADRRGHIYVPRLRTDPRAAESNSESRYVASLVECDELLQELTETPLRHYHEQDVVKSHGMTGLVYLADGTMVFSTHVGYLYLVQPRDDGPATVRELGWFHPGGAAYAPSLFTFRGERYVAGVTLPRPRHPQWTVFDLETGQSTVFPFHAESAAQKPFEKLQIFGSLTRDHRGRFYLAGRHQLETGKAPLLLQVEP